MLLLKFCGILLFAFANGNVLNLLKGMATHSEFASLLEETEGIHKYYMNGFVTVFAPSNAALKEYQGEKNKAFILNHIASAFPRPSLQTVNAAVGNKSSEQRLTSLLQGHPPLWIRKKNGNMYVNNAKVSMVLPTTTTNGNKQFLYPIEDVLEPLIPKIENSVADYVDIKAGDLLFNVEKFKLENYTITKFSEQISKIGVSKFPEYLNYGKSTFFIPIDHFFDNQTTDKNLIDDVVVRSHIVPGNLLFTNPIKKKEEETDLYHTLQYKQSSMDVKVVVSMFKDNKKEAMIQSQTITGNRNHPRGKVIASIVKGNIPVQNGVVHLINRPLVILANTLWEMLDPSKPENKRFSKFSKYIEKNDKLLKIIQNTKVSDSDDDKNGATVFVPTNAAIEDLKAHGISDEKIIENLGLHFLDFSLESTDIRITQPQNSFKMFGTNIGFSKKDETKIWLWNDTKKEIQVDGLGVQATIVDSDIRAKNGIIHQIDRVLGIPLTTIFEKLKTDPMLRLSYKLGEQDNFNSKFSNIEAEYTYLVPTNEAWIALQKQYASAYKVLFNGQFFYQANNILDRHLKIGSALNIEDIVKSNKLTTVRGAPLQVSLENFEGENAVFITHEEITARVIRSNLRCSNGYIHIIDKVIMKRRDVTLSDVQKFTPKLIITFFLPLFAILAI